MIREEKIKVGFKDDTLFLLSTEEYEIYKNVIPYCMCTWWLRSPGYAKPYASVVCSSGYVKDSGRYVNLGAIGIRPALRTEQFPEASIGDVRVIQNFPFTKIDNDLFIALVPITFNRFDDKEDNEYERSYIRNLLKEKSKKLFI